MDTVPARLGHVRLRDLLLLEAIERHRTLGRVAEALHVTQPAVSMALKALERAFDVTLVERDRRGVTLTAAGRAALAPLRAVGAEIGLAFEAARAPDRSCLRLGCSPMAALEVVPRALARLRRARPEVDVAMAELPVPVLWDQLRDGVLDAIVSRRPGEAAPGRAGGGIASAVVGSERLVLVAGRDHAAVREDASLLALSRFDWAMPPRGTLANHVFEQWFVGRSLPVPRVAITTTSFLTSLRLAGHCGLLTLVPQSALRLYGRGLGLTVVSTPWDHPRGDLVAAWRHARGDDPLLRALLACFATADAPAAMRRP